MKREFDKEFQNPGSEFRGAPFWAWNCKLDQQQLLEQIDYFKEMGMGGFHIHCRIGLNTPYMGDEFLTIVKACVEKAKKYGMLAWLYDEDRWPSGFGGGLVTKEEEYRSRVIVFSPVNKNLMNQEEKDVRAGADLNRSSNGNGKLLARYEITLKDGLLAHYHRLEEGEDGENIWYAYLEVAQSDPWYNNQTYVDTLNPKAINRFIETTHEKYAEVVGEYFGTTIPAIFTDEPQFTRRNTLGYADEKKDIILPYTDDFKESYSKLYGEEFFDILPELIWELPNNKVSASRYHYHDHLAERFASAFADTLGNWCKQHNIMLTGHMMEEPTLHSQTCAIGEAMRSYRSFEQPGIDMLCDWREYTTAKQAQSAARQFGCKGTTSELYGVTNWDFDFRGHKLQGDWQAALGVVTRVHHLAWVSMEGEAKRDYPASIFYQSPWYKEYSLIENHFARVNLAMTEGKPCVKVGVIHPIESYWLAFGPEEQTATLRKHLEQNFDSIVQWLLFGFIDFDFIAESLLAEQSEVVESKLFAVGECAYEIVIVPECKTIRRTTLERLTSFVAGGGKVIFMGDVPSHIDALPSIEVAELSRLCESIPFSQSDLMDKMETVRTVDIWHSNGVRADNYIYQMRDCGNEKWLFIANGKEVLTPDVTNPEMIKIIIGGNYTVQLNDTLKGTAEVLPTKFMSGKTEITYTFYPHDSLLLHYSLQDSFIAEVTEEIKSVEASKVFEEIQAVTEKRVIEEKRVVEEIRAVEEIKADEQLRAYKDIITVEGKKEYIPSQVVRGAYPISLSEPNVLLLDQAEYALNDENWQALEEVLRIENILRGKLNYPLKLDAYAQPWTNEKSASSQEYQLKLKYVISSKINIIGAKLALEGPDKVRITLNGVYVSNESDGWYTDQCIRTIPMPLIPAGDNILELTMNYNHETNLEWAYLLGDFGVEVHGDRATITEPVRNLSFGDWTHQGLAFYGGNVTYHCEVALEKGDYELEISKYRAPLLSVKVNGEEKGKIIFAPYKLPLGDLIGLTTIDITVFGSRINTFGALHNCDDSCVWHGPSAWRTEGMSYSYEYQLKKCGILAAPRLNILNK
jgi:hypothetical protein